MWKIFTSKNGEDIYSPGEEKANSECWLLDAAAKLVKENPTMRVFLGNFRRKDLKSGTKNLIMQEWFEFTASSTTKNGWTLGKKGRNVKIKIG